MGGEFDDEEALRREIDALLSEPVIPYGLGPSFSGRRFLLKAQAASGPIESVGGVTLCHLAGPGGLIRVTTRTRERLAPEVRRRERLSPRGLGSLHAEVCEILLRAELSGPPGSEIPFEGSAWEYEDLLDELRNLRANALRRWAPHPIEVDGTGVRAEVMQLPSGWGIVPDLGLDVMIVGFGLSLMAISLVRVRDLSPYLR